MVRPCRAIGPVIEELSKEYDGKVNIGKVIVDHNPQVSMDYGSPAFRRSFM